MKKIILITLILLGLITAQAMGDTLKDEEAMRAFTDRVMTHVAKGDLGGAFEALKPYVNLSPTEIDAVAVQSKAQREQYGQRYGSAIAFEFIDDQKVGQSLYRLRYIEKTNKHALAWQFYFYKTAEGWTLNTFFWNDMFHKLF